jgi:iron(III) transport system substrate-binding protein
MAVFNAKGEYVGVSALQFPSREEIQAEQQSQFAQFRRIPRAMVLPGEDVVKATAAAKEQAKSGKPVDEEPKTDTPPAGVAKPPAEKDEGAKEEPKKDKYGHPGQDQGRPRRTRGRPSVVLRDARAGGMLPPMVFFIGSIEVDTVKVRAWVNSSRGRTLAFWLTVAAVVLLPLTAWIAFGRSGRRVDDGTKVTLYTTADDPLVRQVVEAFKAETGVDVRIVTDTEATRGALAQRVLSEREKPRADVWWASEVVTTIKLAEAGALAPWMSTGEATVEGGWPKHLRPVDRRWYGFAQRARVIAFNSNQLAKGRVPVKLRDLIRPDLKGKVGMADPRFGTTRSHMAYLCWMAGEDEFRSWLRALNDNGLQVLQSNSEVVRALGRGDIAVGLTDTDDVWSGQREKWPIDVVYETPDTARDRLKPGQLPSKGVLVLPNSVGRILGSPHAKAGNRLADFLLSEKVEEMLAQSDSRNIPVRPALIKKYQALAIPAPAAPAEADYAAIARAEEAAARIVGDILGR